MTSLIDKISFRKILIDTDFKDKKSPAGLSLCEEKPQR